MNFMHLIPIKSVFILIIGMLVINYGFLNLQPVALALNNTQFLLLVLSVTCISSSGFAIVNFSNQEYKSKVGISEKNVYNIYAALNILGVGIGYYLSSVVNKPNFVAIFILISSTIYIYGVYLSKIRVAWSVIKTLLLPLSIILIGIFSIYPTTHASNQLQMRNLFNILLDYALFAFAINSVIEFIAISQETKSIKLHKVRIITSASLLIIAFFVSHYTYKYFIAHNLHYATSYVLLCVVLPLLYSCFKTWFPPSATNFRHIATVLQVALLLGIISIAIVSLNIAYNAEK